MIWLRIKIVTKRQKKEWLRTDSLRVKKSSCRQQIHLGSQRKMKSLDFNLVFQMSNDCFQACANHLHKTKLHFLIK